MGEVRALEVRNVELEHDRLLVRRAMSADEVMPPKSGHERVVPLAPVLRVILVEAMLSRLAQERVVTNAKGRTPGRQQVLTVLKALEQRCGLRERSFHSRSHYFCSTLIRRGTSVEAVRLLAGHLDREVTQRHVRATAVWAAIATLGGQRGRNGQLSRATSTGIYTVFRQRTVGEAGFEPATTSTQSSCTTGLCDSPV